MNAEVHQQSRVRSVSTEPACMTHIFDDIAKGFRHANSSDKRRSSPAKPHSLSQYEACLHDADYFRYDHGFPQTNSPDERRNAPAMRRSLEPVRKPIGTVQIPVAAYGAFCANQFAPAARQGRGDKRRCPNIPMRRADAKALNKKQRPRGRGLLFENYFSLTLAALPLRLRR